MTNELRDEMAVAADFLADNGFLAAADVLRVMYPRLPVLILGIRELIIDMAKTKPDIDQWQLEVREPDSTLILPIDTVIRWVRTEKINYFVTIRLEGTSQVATKSANYSGNLYVLKDNVEMFYDKLHDSVPVHSGDTIRLSCEVSLPSFLLPDKVVKFYNTEI